MALLEKYLVVKKSTLPGAGKGLFTKRDIAKGERIVEYKGRITDWKTADHRDNPTIFMVSRNHVIDARPFKKALAKYANDARGLVRVKGIVNNAEYEETDDKRIYITALKDIPAGSEIFVAYGKEYWDVIRYNQKLERA